MAATISGIVLSRYRRDYEETRSPISVWRAVEFCVAKKLPFPSWVVAYLGDSAKNICTLARGQSFRSGGRRVSHEDASALIPAAFGFTRPGYSAFAEDENRAKRRQDLFNFWLERAGGESEQQALEGIADRRNLAEVRSVRRRIAKAKNEAGMAAMSIGKPKPGKT